MLNIGVSLIIFLYVTAVCLFALYFILKISFKEKRLQGDDDFIQDFIKKQDERIKDRGINFSTKMYFRIMFTAPFILGIVFFFVLDGSYMCLLCAALGLVLPEFFLYIITNNSKKKFDERFAKSLKQLSSSLRAGMSIVQAVDDVANCTLLHDSMRKKYAQISSDIMMGITVGEAFRRFADGTGSPDAQDVAIALDVQNEVGGHEAEVVQEIADNAEGENETFCHSSIRTNCRYSIPDKPDVSLSKNTLKYGESTEMYIKNLGSSGNTDIDHQEFKMNIPARLDIEKIKMPEFDNADVELYINGKKVEVENGEYIPEKAVASIELMIRTKEQTFKQTSDMSFILKNSVDTKGSENLQAFSKTVCANKTTFKVYSESLNIKFEKENVKDDDKNNNDGKDDDAKKDDDKKDDNGKEPSKPSVPTTPVTPTPIPNPSDNNTPVTPSPNDKNKKEEEKKNKKPVKIVDNTGLSLKKAKVTSNKGAVYDFTSNDTKSVASIMKDGTNMDNETKIENDIPDNSTEEKNNLEEEMEKVKEKKAQNPVKKVKNNRFAKVAIVGGIVLSACIIASYFLLRTPKEETRKGGVDDKKNND